MGGKSAFFKGVSPGRSIDHAPPEDSPISLRIGIAQIGLSGLKKRIKDDTKFEIPEEWVWGVYKG